MKDKSYWLTQDQIDDLLDVLVNGYMYSEENEGQRVWITDFESYASSRGASRFSSDVAAQRLPNTSEGQRRRIAEQQLRVSQANASRRESLRKEYDLMVSRGEIRPPTRIEELQRTARGNPDNASVQAARRLLRKRNIRW